MKAIIARTTFVLLAALTLTISACDDGTEVEEHFDVEGFALLEGSEEIYRYMLEDGAPPTLQLTTGIHEVVFRLLDHDGDPLIEEGHDDDEEEHVLEVSSEDQTVLTWTPEQHTDDHDFVEFHGELRAVAAGTTTLTVCVPHGAHCDFTADVPVTVIEQ